MSNQGNIFLGYNLALLVLVGRDDNWDQKTVTNQITGQARSHLQIRFNKGNAKDKRKKVNEIFRKRTKFIWLDMSSPSIASFEQRNKKDIGKVYVFLIDDNEKVLPENRKQIQERLRQCDMDIRIEWLRVNFPKRNLSDSVNKGITDKENKELENRLYHLASRICESFVEYQSEGIQVIPNGKIDFTKSGGAKNVLKAIDISEPKKIGAKPIREELVVKKILDIRCAIDLVCEGLDGCHTWIPPIPQSMSKIYDHDFAKDNGQRTRYKFPFGLWFRGASRVCHDLSPTLYREEEPEYLHPNCNKKRPPAVWFDESSMIRHFMLHTPELRQEYHGVFEWLCLMQHYNAPSRLLDWSENILTALYFAVCDQAGTCDGAVWVLNAGRLNERSRVSGAQSDVCMPDSTDVILRSALAISRTRQELKGNLVKHGQLDILKGIFSNTNFYDWLNGKTRAKDDWWHRLSYPVAVFPSRLNARIANQHAAFTIHGGKYYEENNKILEKDKVPPRKSLMDLSRLFIKENRAPFLDVYIVPSCARRKLREQLKRLGVHRASVLPELEYQAEHIRNQWRFGMDK